MKKKVSKMILIPFSLIVVTIAAGGCTTKFGEYIPNSHFIEPNSNVTTLGPVKASTSKTRFFLAPDLSSEDVKETYRKALSGVSGANALINVKEDTTVTLIPFVFMTTVEYTLEGEAVKVEVGKQELK
jgi:hypothetical protein